LLTEFLKNIPWISWLKWLNNINNLDQPKLVIVPLSNQSIKQRGFNQSVMIADYISQTFKLTVVDCLLKVKNNQKQAMINGFWKRRKNVNGVYQVKKKINVNKQNLIIIDDVITTGATITEIGRVLKLAGANQVWALSLFQGG